MDVPRFANDPGVQNLVARMYRGEPVPTMLWCRVLDFKPWAIRHMMERALPSGAVVRTVSEGTCVWSLPKVGDAEAVRTFLRAIGIRPV